MFEEETSNNTNKEKAKTEKVKKNKTSSKRESIFQFGKYLNNEVSISLFGTREITGVIKSYDQFSNLILDDVIETFKDGTSRELGLVFIKGTAISSLVPGKLQPIENPFY